MEKQSRKKLSMILGNKSMLLDNCLLLIAFSVTKKKPNWVVIRLDLHQMFIPATCFNQIFHI